MFALQNDGWLDRWMETVADLTQLKNAHPMFDAVIDEQDGRRIRIGDRWLFDFASSNYLGFDRDREIIDAACARRSVLRREPRRSNRAATSRIARDERVTPGARFGPRKESVRQRERP